MIKPLRSGDATRASRKPGSVGVIKAPVRRLACLSDIHGNTPALAAVLRSEEFASADAVAVLGCVSPGPDPRGTLRLCQEIPIPTYCLAGNGERAILEMAAGTRQAERNLDRWLVKAHRGSEREMLSRWPSGLTCTLSSGRRIRLCHGSPRSDVEVVTPETPVSRLLEAFADIDEETIVHGHTHLQYERREISRHIIGPGSVGLPYTDGAFGARWALISDQVELIVTSYDIDEVDRLIRQTGYPSDRFLEDLRNPPTPASIIAYAEERVFSD